MNNSERGPRAKGRRAGARSDRDDRWSRRLIALVGGVTVAVGLWLALSGAAEKRDAPLTTLTPSTDAPARTNISRAPFRTGAPQPSSLGNRYRAIVERNPFGLRTKPAPQPLAPTPLRGQPSPLKLTGVVTFPPAKLAMFVLQETGKPLVTSAVLREGQKSEYIPDLEVVKIDATAGAVEVRFRGHEMVLNFADHGVRGQAAPTPPPGGSSALSRRVTALMPPASAGPLFSRGSMGRAR